MKRQFSGLDKKFDLVVIGGGVIGTGIARDAALRGIRTLLLEKEDFGYGTTSRSTRLIHGGLRYLSHLDFKLVRQDLKEREVLLKIAPNLVKPLPFLLPLRSAYQHLIMGAGMRMYDAFAKGKSVPSYRHLSRQQTMEMEPGINWPTLKGSYEFFDAQVAFPERLCVENALSATGSGAVLLNHAQVVAINKTGSVVVGVKIKDGLSRETAQVEAKAVVSAAGHWSNDVVGLAIPHAKDHVTTTMGVHLVTPRLSSKALVLFAKSDGRLIFVIPWQEYSLIGTTDTEYKGDKEYLSAEAGHVAYLLKEVSQYLPKLKAEDIYWAFAGLRSLVGGNGRKISNVSRSHKVVDHESTDGVSGLVSVLGGKMTGYRAIAEETVDIIARKLGVSASCSTGSTFLPGAPGLTDDQVSKVAVESGLDIKTVAHLNEIYGSRLNEVVKLAVADENGKKQICPHSKDIFAQVWHAIDEESCATVSDFMLRRGTIGLSSCQGLDAVETVGLEMGRKLGWSVGEFQDQVQNYRDFAGVVHAVQTRHVCSGAACGVVANSLAVDHSALVLSFRRRRSSLDGEHSIKEWRMGIV